jgi:hypothetical protein
MNFLLSGTHIKSPSTRLNSIAVEGYYFTLSSPQSREWIVLSFQWLIDLKDLQSAPKERAPNQLSEQRMSQSLYRSIDQVAAREAPILSAGSLFKQIRERVFSTVRRLHP